MTLSSILIFIVTTFLLILLLCVYPPQINARNTNYLINKTRPPDFKQDLYTNSVNEFDIKCRPCNSTKYLLNRQEAKPNEAPFIVSIQREKDGKTKHHGAAVIINEKQCITVGHNLEEMYDGDDKFYILAGCHDISANEDHHQRLSIDRFKKHEHYFTFNDGKRNSFDIGLIYTRESIRFTHNVQPIELPDSPEIPEGDVYFYGWGNLSKTDEPNYPTKLQKSLMPIITHAVCSQILGAQQIGKNRLCAGFLDGANSICNGDSGGPLVHYIGNKPILIGLASYGATPCGQIDSPSIFTKIHKFIDWIRANADKDN